MITDNGEGLLSSMSPMVRIVKAYMLAICQTFIPKHKEEKEGMCQSI